MSANKKLHVQIENLAMPEIHTDSYEEKQKKSDVDENKERKEKDVVYDNVAIPEIHFRKKKKP